jgi:uncharacterized protein (DUF488 family)
MNKLYTFGYYGRTREELERVRQELGAVVVDIRYNPTSRNAAWRKGSLEAFFPADAYRYLQYLGNRNYKRQGIQILDLETGLDVLQGWLEDRPVILLCVCKKVHYCHRLLVAEAAAERFGVTVQHL